MSPQQEPRETPEALSPAESPDPDGAQPSAGSQAEAEDRSYVAFISYRHKDLDRQAAVRIQKKIENYIVPKEYREKVGGKKLGIVFRDEDELPASSSLSDSITYALDHTQFLIVICTPDLPQSKWCLQEISYFLKTHDRDHVLAVLVDGTPEESFPDQLRFTYDDEGRELAEVEPLAANIAGENHSINWKTFNKEVVRLFAAIIGCPFDALWQRERRARTNRLIAAMGVGLSAMAVVIGIVLSKNAQISEQNAQIMEQNDQILEQNDQIQEQNAQISDQNIRLQQQMSSVLVDSGRMQLESFDRKAALNYALEALESDDPSVYDHRAERLLADTLGAYDYQEPNCEILFRQSTEIKQLAITGDGTVAFTADASGTVHALDAAAGTLLWEQPLDLSLAPNLYPLDQQKLILCKTDGKVTALSVEDGTVVWEYTYAGGSAMQILSEDRTLFATLDQGSYTGSITEPTLMVLNTADGTPVMSLPIVEEDLKVRGSYILDAPYHWGGAFSADNSQFLCALPARTTDEEESQRQLFLLVDLQAGTRTRLGTFSSDPDMVLTTAFAGNDKGYFALTNGPHLYSVLLPFDPTAEKTVNVYDYTMSSRSGFAAYDYLIKARPYIPALISDGLAITFSSNEVYLMDLSNASRRNTLDLDSPIVTAAWLDRDQEIFQLVTEGGWTLVYDVSHEDNKAIESLHGEDSVLSKVTNAVQVENGHYENPDSGLTLTVSEDDPRQITVIRKHTEPALKALDDSAVWDKTWRALVSPSGKRVFIVGTNSEGAMTSVFDMSTGELLGEISFPYDSFISNIHNVITVTDDEHFVFNGVQYGLDGSQSAFMETDAYSRLRYSRICPDGTLLSTREEIGEDDGQLLFDTTSLNYQLGYEPEDRHRDLEDTITMLSDSSAPSPQFFWGDNGWLAGYGLYIYRDTDQSLKSTESPALVVQNALTGEKSVLFSDAEEQGVPELVFAHEKPLLACFHEDGRIQIYDLEKGTDTGLPVSYSYGEIALVAFSDRDGYLLVYTDSSHVDCFDLETNELVYSEDDPFPIDTDESFPSLLTAQELPEEHRLFLFSSTDYYSGNGAILDTEAWVNVQQIEDLCTWSSDCRTVLLQMGKTTGLCPIHTIETLKDWAKDQLR